MIFFIILGCQQETCNKICDGVESWGGGSTAVQLINHNGLTSAPHAVMCDSCLMRSPGHSASTASGVQASSFPSDGHLFSSYGRWSWQMMGYWVHPAISFNSLKVWVERWVDDSCQPPWSIFGVGSPWQRGLGHRASSRKGWWKAVSSRSQLKEGWDQYLKLCQVQGKRGKWGPVCLREVHLRGETCTTTRCGERHLYSGAAC